MDSDGAGVRVHVQREHATAVDPPQTPAHTLLFSYLAAAMRQHVRQVLLMCLACLAPSAAAAGGSGAAATTSNDAAAAAAVAAAKPPPPPPQAGPWLSQPFVAGVGGYADYRIPALVLTPTADGGSLLLAFCEGRKYSSADMDWNDIVLRRSSDGGLTWGALQLVHGESSSKHHVTIGNPSPVVVASQPGRVVLTGTRQTREGFRVVSDDFGKTWGKAVYQPHLDAQRQHGSGTPKPAYGQPASNWTFYMPGPASGIQLPSGRLVVGAYHGVEFNSSRAGGEAFSFAIYRCETPQHGLKFRWP